jgi:WD40 repeat protein
MSAAHCFLVRRVEARCVGVHDRRTGALLRELTGHSAKIERVTASADGTYLTGVCVDGSALIWDLATGKAVAQFERAFWAVTAAVCADDRRTAIAADQRGVATVWDLVGRKALAQHRVHTDTICALHVLGTQRVALTASRDRSIKVWELSTGRVLTRYWCEASVTACVLTSDQRTVVAGDENGRIHILRLEGTTLQTKEARSPVPMPS